MSDIATIQLDASGRFDWLLDGPSLAQDDGLVTAVIHSLFCDARALDDDELPPGETDRRGWPGDALVLPQGDHYGSRLWLLRRSKQTQQTLNRAREYALEALRWMREDGVADRIEVEALIVRSGVLGLNVTIYAPTQRELRLQFANFWSS